MPLEMNEEMLGSLDVALIDNLLWRIKVDIMRWSMIRSVDSFFDVLANLEQRSMQGG
jgi:hypothetical protein